jgi:hypothetical protein
MTSIANYPPATQRVRMTSSRSKYVLKGTHLDDFGTRESLSSLHRIVPAFPPIQLLPLLLEVVHCFLLLLASGRCVESDEVSGGVELEDLRAIFGIDADEDHC